MTDPQGGAYVRDEGFVKLSYTLLESYSYMKEFKEENKALACPPLETTDYRIRSYFEEVDLGASPKSSLPQRIKQAKSQTI